MFSCAICFGDYDAQNPEDKDSELRRLEKCKHTFCAECFREFYRTLIEDMYQHDCLRCPQHGCDAKPTLEEVKKIINEDSFNKYIQFTKDT